MISSVEIKGLRGIKQGKLDNLTPLVVLVGPNNAGKSTILEALLIGSNTDISEAIVVAVNRKNGLSEKARWLVASKASECVVSVKNDRGDSRTVTLQASREAENKQTRITGTVTTRIEKQRGSVESGVSVVPQNTKMAINPISFNDGAVGYAQTTSSFRGIPEVHLVDVEMVAGLSPLHELYTRVVEQGRRKEARELLSHLVQGVDDILILTEGDRPLLYLDYGDSSVPVALAGEGIQSLLRIILELASRPGGVVLLEEPEVHQHPGAIRQSARAIWAAIRRNIQVVISTHSLELIDALLSEVENQEELDKMSVYRLLLKDGCLRSSRTAGSDIAFARTEIGDDLR